MRIERTRFVSLRWDTTALEGGLMNGVILMECLLMTGHHSVNPKGWYGFPNRQSSKIAKHLLELGFVCTNDHYLTLILILPSPPMHT